MMIIMAVVKGTASQWLATLWPSICKLCGCRSDRTLDACSHCLTMLARVDHACLRCALVLPHTVEQCGACSRRPPTFDSARAAFIYRQPVAGLIQRFKFNGDLAAGRLLAQLTAMELNKNRSDASAPQPQLMISVPLHRARQWRRGFNQAEWLCRDLGTAFGIDWQAVLKRCRATRTQSDLPAKNRAGNVAGAFRVQGLPAGLRHAVLVDDVMTTGTTLNECARVLKSAGLERVDVWVIARA